LSLHHFSFDAPWWLLVLLLAPLLVAFATVLRRRRARYTVTFTNLAALAGVRASPRSRRRRWIPTILFVLALVAVAGALARPHVWRSAAGGGATIVLLVDVSGSMQATDVKPARIYAAITAMHEFVKALPPTDKVGLVTFSDKVKVITPPTTDHAAVDGGLDVLSPEGGTALGSGVETAVKVVRASLAADGVRRSPGQFVPGAIVLESDGAQDRGSITPIDGANLAKGEGIRIYGVAVGTPGGRIVQGSGLLREVVRVPPAPSTVRLLAQETGGQAYDAGTAKRLNSIYRGLGSKVGRHPVRTDITSWFEVAAAVLLVASVGAARAWGGALP
jgi:Ca-activated chloride channel family protein